VAEQAMALNLNWRVNTCQLHASWTTLSTSLIRKLDDTVHVCLALVNF